MSKSFPLPTEPEGVIPSLIERFNSGKVEVQPPPAHPPDGDSATVRLPEAP